jgi:class 3 adenylate cyclase
MSDSDRAQYLRRLRFPEEIEAGFQQDYYQKFLPSLRKILLALVFLIAFVVLREMTSAYFSSKDPSAVTNTARGLAGTISAIPILLIFRKLTYLKSFNNYCQVFSTIFLVLIFLFLCLSISYSRNLREILIFQQFKNISNNDLLFSLFKTELNGSNTYFLIRIIPIGMIFLSAFRLQFRWAFTSMFSMAVIAIWCVIKPLKIGISPEFIGVTIQVSCTSIVGAYFVALVQERLAREAFLANYLLDIERAKSERLLTNVLPETVARRLKDESTTISDSFESVTVIFADIVNFTQLAANLSAEELVSQLNAIFSTFDSLTEKHGLEKIKTIGDAYMAVAGVPEPNEHHAQAAADLALALQEAIGTFARETGEPLRLRIGLHSGPVVAGVIGTKKFIYDLWGDTVNTASRMESQGTAGEIQVTQTTYDLLQTHYTFGPAQELEVKGKGLMQAYCLISKK